MNQNGNAIVMILIAVALFAALSYAFTYASRTSTSFISDEEAKAYANQIIAYGNEVKSAVKRLQLRGCSDTQISFENSVVTGYTNPNAPTDKSCHVFDIAGGGLNFIKISENILDNSYSANTSYGIFNTTGDVRILNVGTSLNGPTGNELIGVVSFINKNICQAINKNLDFSYTSNNPPISLFYANAFDGDYNHIAQAIMNVGLTGKKSFCFDHVGLGKYIYYITLIAR